MEGGGGMIRWMQPWVVGMRIGLDERERERDGYEMGGEFSPTLSTLPVLFVSSAVGRDGLVWAGQFAYPIPE